MTTHLPTCVVNLLKLLTSVSLGICMTACGGAGENDGGGDDGGSGASFASSSNLPANGSTGGALYASYCAGCHGASYAAAKNYASTLSAIARNKGGMGYLSASIQTAQADDIATYLSFGAGTASAAVLSQSIIFTNPGNQTLGAAATTLSATASSGLLISFSSSTPGVCAVNGSALELLSVGLCTLSASQMGNATYAAASPVSVSLTVSAALGIAQTIAMTAPGDQVLGSAAPSLVASASSGLPVSFASVTQSVCSVSGNSLNLLKPGTCTVAANQPGNATFAAAVTVQSNLYVVAPNAPAGKTAYNLSISGQSCFTCHGVPGSQPTSLILSAANADVVLNSAIVNNKGGMGVLSGRYSAQQILDIAAYLATPNF